MVFLIFCDHLDRSDNLLGCFLFFFHLDIAAGFFLIRFLTTFWAFISHGFILITFLNPAVHDYCYRENSN